MVPFLFVDLTAPILKHLILFPFFQPNYVPNSGWLLAFGTIFRIPWSIMFGEVSAYSGKIYYFGCLSQLRFAYISTSFLLEKKVLDSSSSLRGNGALLMTRGGGSGSSNGALLMTSYWIEQRKDQRCREGCEEEGKMMTLQSRCNDSTFSHQFSPLACPFFSLSWS